MRYKSLCWQVMTPLAQHGLRTHTQDILQIRYLFYLGYLLMEWTIKASLLVTYYNAESIVKLLWHVIIFFLNGKQWLLLFKTSLFWCKERYGRISESEIVTVNGQHRCEWHFHTRRCSQSLRMAMAAFRSLSALTKVSATAREISGGYVTPLWLLQTTSTSNRTVLQWFISNVSLRYYAAI